MNRPICGCGVGHTKVKGEPYKYRMMQNRTYKLRYVQFREPFQHCGRKNGEPTDSPMIAGNDSQITFYEGYSWDGASGPVLDTKSVHLASLVHDGLYQAIRLRKLNEDQKGKADKEYLSIYRKQISWWQFWKWARYYEFKLGLLIFGRPGNFEEYINCNDGA